ncbi:MAG: hypothetical protein ACK5ND_09805 [Bacteroides sp.]
MIKKLISKNKMTLIGIVLGAIGGYLYWKFVGCNGGNCMITSSPINSSIWGAAIGGLFFNIFEQKPKKKD